MGLIELPRAESIVDLIERTLPPQRDWIKPYILPKSGTMLFGAEAKAGKSMVMMELCRALASGEDPFNYEEFTVPDKGVVMLIDCELGEYGLKDRCGRILRSGKTELNEFRKNFWYVTKDPTISLSSPKGVDRLVSLVEEVQPNILALDPIGKLHFFDENSNTEVSKLFNRIERIQASGRAQEMTVLISHHFGKPPQSQRDAPSEVDRLSPYAFRGASKWFDNPDTLVTMARVSELPNSAWRLRTRWITRHGPRREDILLTVNRGGNFETRFESVASERVTQPHKEKSELFQNGNKS